MGRVGNKPIRYLIKTNRVSVNLEELHIANFCLNYLNFGCFDADLSDSDIRDFLRQGYYSFEDYAIAHWLDHVDSCTSRLLPSEADALARLTQTIDSFFMRHGLNAPPDKPVPTDQRFQIIRQCDFIKRLDSLAQLARQRRSNENLLDLETQLQRRRLIYEDLVMNVDPHNDTLHTLSFSNEYRWFKCPKTWCDFFADGFQNKERRDIHVNQHERPFRCSFEECLYAELGFETENHAKRHEKKSHPTGKGSEWAFPTHKPKKKLDIFSACKKGDLATVERLVREGADMNQPSRPKGSRYPLSLAAKYNHPQVVSYLIRQGCEQPPQIKKDFFFDEFHNTSIAILQMILDMEADPERKKIRAHSALMRAAVYNREDAIPLLLTYGIDINQKIENITGWYERRWQTVLQYARKNGHDSFAQALRDHGARDETPEPNQPLTPRPATPVTPRPPTPVTPQQISFNSDLNNPDILENFDFEQFLKGSDTP